MALNFNVDPWYDDFDPTKNFHRILFKPGYAVQARELTQAQTILQDQISKFGNGIYKDGSKVTGANIFVDTKVVTCKLTSSSATQITSYTNLFVVGATSKFVAQVVGVDVDNYYIKTKAINTANGKAFASGETLNFFTTKVAALSSLNATITPRYTDVAATIGTLTRLSTGTYLSKELTIPPGNISVGDTITFSTITFKATVTSVNSTGVVLNYALPADVTNEITTITNQISVRALEVGIDEGVWFTGGFFVRNGADSIIPDALNAYPSVVVGFEVVETYEDSADDASLLDPAIGASNYQAPGADRYVIRLNLVTKPYVSDQTVANLTTNKFIELVRINAGVVEDINNVPVFSSISKAIAEAVSDQSGDFIVNPFSLLLSNSVTEANNFGGSISSGKVYLNGSPVEHISQTPYVLEKARDTESQINQDIVTYYGNYATVKDLKGSILNFQTGATVELHNVALNTASSASKIGTANIRNFDYDSGSGTSTQYNLFLFDIQSNQSFSNVVSIVSPNGSNYSVPLFAANTVAPAMTVDSGYDFLLFPLPQKNIANVSSANYVTHRYYTAPTFINGVTTITTNGINETFVGGTGAISGAERQFNYGVITTSSSGSYPAGHFIPMDQANVSITITNTPGTPQATINIAGGFNGSGTIYATLSVNNDTIKSKVLQTNVGVKVSANTINTKIDLGKSDIYNFRGVFELGNTHPYQGAWASGSGYNSNDAVLYDDANVYISLVGSNSGHQPNTSPTYWSVLTNNVAHYSTDNGQTDIYYDHGSIKNVSGQSKGNVVAVIDYFTHSGGTGFFDVSSYAIPYADIPSYTSAQHGTTYQLRDMLDFRPRRTDGIGTTTFDTFQLPAPFQNVFTSYGYYLSRTDKIVLYPNGQFKTIRGISSYINPVTPSDVPGALTLFTINYPAYTFSKNDVAVTPNKTRRYTMKDIGVLDKRIFNLEYYTSLSSLENQVTGSDVTDATGLNLLFKNGFLTDSFKGQNVGDVLNPDYAVSVDFTKQLARPLFTSTVPNYYVDPTQGTFVTSGKINNQLSLNNNIVTFSYSENTLVFQNIATEIVNVNPFNVVNFVGNVKLSPSSDVWYDTQTQPNINIVNEDQAAWQAAVGGTGNGSQWNDWQLNWTGENPVSTNDQGTISRDTTAITNAIAKQGLSGTVNGGNIQVSTTTKILSNAIVPFARTIPVKFELFGMTPYTHLHTYLDGINVDYVVTPDSGSSDGLYFIDITNAGTGYTDGNNQSIITITGNNTLPAISTANVYGGKIVSVDIQKTGSGYRTLPSLQVTGSNTSTALLTARGTSFPGAKLITNSSGYASGTINIPNDEFVKLPTGIITVEFGDNFTSPLIGQTYAKATFSSQGTLNSTQTTVVSTRPPKVSPKPQVVSRPTDPTPTPAPSTPNTSTVTYFRGGTSDPLNVGASDYAIGSTKSYNYIESFAEKAFSTATGQTNVNFDTQVVKDTFDHIVGSIETAQTTVTQVGATTTTTVTPPTGTEALAASLYITNEIAAGKSLEVAQAELDKIISDNADHLQDLAVQYVQQNQTEYNSAHAAGDASCANGVDPLSQNFFVNANLYPNGVFLSSAILYFATKDSTVPVNIRIRPTVNGYPDAVNDIPGSLVYKNPSEVNVPDVGAIETTLGPATTFTFDYPIYLKPGEYSLMIAADSNQYNMYASKLGGVQYGTQNVVTQLNYLGALFKSQNASTWVPAVGETLTFNLNICDFAGGTASFDAITLASDQVDYDVMHLITQDLAFNNLGSINYKALTRDLTTRTLSSPINLLADDNYNFTVRQTQSEASDIILRPTLTNTDRWTSPVIDLERLNTILVKNIINSWSQGISDSEALGGYYNGTAVAKYITRRVTLNNNFDSTGLTIFLDVNRQPGTKIEVYYKVLNITDLNKFDDQPYVLMNPILAPGAGLAFTGTSDWTSDTYQQLNINYNDITTGANYGSFNIFAIKVVMYSSNPAIVPQIKNFRAIATA